MNAKKSSFLPLCGVAVNNKMTGPVTKNFAKFETFRLVQLPVRSGATSRHLVRLIDDHKIPIRLRQFRRQFLGPGQLINASDEHVLFEERVPSARFLNGSTRHDVETQTELRPKARLATAQPGFPAPRSSNEQHRHGSTTHG